jgi:hypothetical protein
MHRDFWKLWRGALVMACLATACGNDDETGPTLSPPTGLTAEATSATQVHLAWNAVTGATSYAIQRAEGAQGAFAAAGTSNTTTFDDQGLTPGTLYRYQVAAVSGSSTSGYSSEASVTLTLGTVEVTADVTASTTWTKNNVYTLKGFIHVQNGATLTIEAGTKIVGDFNTIGSSLLVLRGAKLIANGTATEPIVFTSSRNAGERQAGDWGGLIIVGNGIINRANPVILEGSGVGAGNPEINYAGGTDNSDNSGSLKYVRVEFAGYATAPDQEFNSFTFAAVGSGTQFDHLESLNGLDDAYEFFGGASDPKYLVSYNAGDDHFDMSEGYVGRIQFAIAYQTRTVIPRATAGNVSSDPQGIENDGCNGANCTNGQNSLPLTVPMVANATIIGPPSTVTTSAGQIGMMLRRGTGGFYVNNVVTRWSRAGISLRDQTTLDRITDGNLVLRNLLVTEAPVLFQAASGSTVQGEIDAVANAIEFQTATTATSLFVAVPTGEPADAAALDFTPAAGSAGASGGLSTFTGSIADKAGTVVTATSYRGATGTDKWWQGWTNFAVN